MRSKMTSGRSNLRRALAMNQGDGEIAESCHDLWTLTRAQARTIFSKGHIAHIMRGILNAPMSADQIPVNGPAPPPEESEG